jgi:hypothetical protein
MITPDQNNLVAKLMGKFEILYEPGMESRTANVLSRGSEAI